jgi:Flp pilus assembly protein TadD
MYRYIGLVLLTCALIVSGCDSSNTRTKTTSASLDDSAPTQAEREKTELLQRLERKFEDPQAHFELGQLYLADGFLVQAEHHYNTALSFDPAHRQSQAAMVKISLLRGETEKAKFAAEIYINQVISSAAGSLRLALGFQQQNLDDYALACYKQALQLAPNSAKIHRQIGYYHMSRGNNEQAREYLSKSFQINSNQPEVAGELGRLGVEIKIPRKPHNNPRGLDKIVEQSEQTTR